MPYCPQCGIQTEPDAAFCGACGARLEGQAQVPSPPPSPPPPAPGGRTPWSLLGAIITLAALAVGAVALYDAAANDGDWGEDLFGGGGDEAIVAASSPIPEATVRLVPTVEPTATSETPPQGQPTVTPVPTGYATPEEAIAALLEEAGLTYVGDCDTANLETDVGSYCSRLWEDRSDTIIYAAGLAFSEFGTWLLLAQSSGGDGWTVVDTAEFVSGPEDAVPPWP